MVSVVLGMSDNASVPELYERQATQPPDGLEVPSNFSYIHYKAFRFLTIGAEEYRADDPYEMPRSDWSPARLQTLRLGCEEVFAWKGTTVDTALRGLGITGFYDLVHLFHFEVTGQALMDVNGVTVDRMEIEHVVTGERLTLYNMP
jgi:hypothetical protein